MKKTKITVEGRKPSAPFPSAPRPTAPQPKPEKPSVRPMDSESSPKDKDYQRRRRNQELVRISRRRLV